MAIVAELTEQSRRKILGVVRLVVEPDGRSGEIAFIVADPWQGLGLGTRMIEYMIEICKEKGLETVCAIMLLDNRRAMKILNAMGFTIKYSEDGTATGTLNLKEEEHSSQKDA